MTMSALTASERVSVRSVGSIAFSLMIPSIVPDDQFRPTSNATRVFLSTARGCPDSMDVMVR